MKKAKKARRKELADLEPRGAFSSTRVRVALIVCVLVVALVLLFCFYEPARKPFIDTFGYGLIPLGIIILALLWFILRRRIREQLTALHVPAFLQGFNIWLGLVAFMFAVFGILAFFDRGGNLGDSIIGESTALGILAVFGLILLGIILIVPRRTWQALCYLASETRGSYRRRPLHKGLGHGVRGLADRSKGQAEPAPTFVDTKDEMPTIVKYEPEPEPEKPRWKEPKVVAALRDKIRPADRPKPVAVAETAVLSEPSAPIEPEEPGAPKGRKGEEKGGWTLPSLNLLDHDSGVEPVPVDTELGARIIEEALASYGVEAKVVQANVGPAVTQYGVEPGWDRKFKEIKEKGRDGNIDVKLKEVSKTRVKVERIASLANDLALALEAPSLKIEAPIPGKAMVGIEVPNPIASTVNLRNIIETPPYQKLKSRTKLPLALGKGMSGESVVADLTKMPHLLIAGATNSGKSICMKSIIATLLMQDTPDELRMIMVDPKRVELVSFNNVPHLLTPVIVEHEKAVTVLRWLTREMDHRYERLAEVGARDIESYNKNPRIDKPLPYLLLIIDELAELMMTAAEEVERMLCRLAQLARATGIHLIVATQRPSVDVVTGLIKANFPARISFSVASQVDSRTILDTAGAEKLLGRGDMLFLPPDAPKPKRLQGTYVSEAEIEKVVSFWVSQHPALSGVQVVPGLDDESPSDEKSSEDPMLQKAIELTDGITHLSTSFLQRRLGVGYPRAAKIMDLLEERGIVAPGEAGKSREIIKGRGPADGGAVR
jgi:S-DNA-T family DNA segregation ATPase FtsK/SpoIIIE